MTMQDFHVVTICKVFCLPTLGHDIADIGDFCLGFQKCLSNLLNDDIGQNRGKEEPGPKTIMSLSRMVLTTRRLA